MSTEDTLEKGFKALFESIPELAGITIEQHEDNSKELEPPLVSVHCGTLRRVAPNAPFYESECDFTCMTYIQDDKDRAILKGIYSAIFDYVSLLDKSTLATETGLSIDGLMMDDNGDEERDEDYQILNVKIKTYLTK